jgi:hypothetical protein
MPTCIFCENPARTREHLWPLWIHEKRDFGPIKVQRSRSQEIIIPDPKQKVRTVCKKCNNEWMSDLENENKHVVGCMFDDISIPLHVPQQQLVSVWAVKTAMVFDTTRSRATGIRFFTKGECVAMQTSRSLPDRTRVWVGRVASSHLHASGTDFLSIASDGNPAAQGNVITITTGHFVAQIVVQHFFPGHENLRDTGPKPGAWDRKLIPIWPTQRDWVTWPPPESFTNGGPQGIAYLMDRWRIGKQVDEIKAL